MKTGHTSIKEIRKSPVNRFDCTYHLSDGIHVRQMIDELPFPKKTCGEVSSRIFHAGRWKRVYVDNPNHGITLLGSSSMLKADLEDEKMVSLKYTDELEDKTLQAGWILISCSGTIGKTAYTNSRHAGKLASQDVIRLKPNDILGGGYVYAFLSSKYGYIMLTQGTFGAVIQHIEPDNVSPIPIPVFPEEFRNEVDGMIKKSARLREEAADALDEAVSYFDDIIEINTASTATHKISIRSIRESQNHRFEATFFTSSGAEYDSQIRQNYTWEPLEKFFYDISRPDIFKRKYVSKDSGLMFFGCSELFMATPQSNKYVSKKTDNLAQLALQESWVLLPRSGTIGEVAYATSQHAQKLASEDVIRLKPDNILRGAYAYIFLSSKAGKALLQRAIFGSVIQHIEPPMLKEIPVPIIQGNFDKVANLAISANKKLGEAGQLELDAIAMVEAEIEKWSK